MRYALIADVHANLEALAAVLADVAEWPGASLVCAGDLVGYGPDPDAVIAELAARETRAVAGNHEGMVLGQLGFERCVHAGIRAAVWTARALTPASRRYLAALPATLRLAPDLVVCHGSLDDPEYYLASRRRADAELALLASREPEAKVLVCGHTHHPVLYDAGGVWRGPPPLDAELHLDEGRRWLLNPGAVGQARDGRPLARYARLDAAARTVVFRELAYDHRLTEDKLRRAGLDARVAVTPAAGLSRRLDDVRTRWARLSARLPRS